jgi:uncharacterized protein YbjT (DUF2867 family)
VAGTGLASALAGADAVIDVTNVAARSARVSAAFFERATANLLRAEQAAGVGHHVVLSIVGIDDATSGYYVGKLRQEELVAGGPVPWSLLRTTQFHEFAGQAAAQARIGPVIVVPSMRTATVAAAEVAAALVALAEGPPQGRVPDLGGPHVSNLDDLVRRWLRATGDRRPVVGIRLPGSAGRLMRSGALLPGPGARLGTQTFGEWLATAV